jgi:hypothetical protein
MAEELGKVLITIGRITPVGNGLNTTHPDEVCAKIVLFFQRRTTESTEKQLLKAR